MLRIAYDSRWTDGGIGHFSREVIAGMEKLCVDLVPIEIGDRLSDPWSPLRLGRALRGVVADVFWSPGFMPPWRPSIPAVVTMHDLIHRRHAGVLRRLYYDTAIRPLVRSMVGVITVSEYSRSVIAAWLGPRSPAIHVVGSGARKVFNDVGGRMMLDAPYVLYCGNRRAHKNLARMIEAFARSHAAGQLLLAMTGEPDAALEQLARVHGVSERLRWLGRLEEVDLAKAYRGASLVLLISLEEGFGLPVIEAMACATPVVCSSTSSLGEIAGNAACLVDPMDVSSIAGGIDRVLSDREWRQTLIERGLVRYTAYRWDRVAERVLRALKEAASA